jgi:hypothetical protein
VGQAAGGDKTSRVQRRTEEGKGMTGGALKIFQFRTSN